jgi:hypothetical protein
MNCFVRPIAPGKWGVFVVIDLEAICFGSGTENECLTELRALGGKSLRDAISLLGHAAAA